ncbi:hypothetical protein IQ238_29630 [Pleurocapsales cyanobacterium LEGE 06147]|nr:hypothetical protein [Pleurocapsales cyanobacterium LEGE 06147]
MLKNWIKQRWDEFDSFRDCVDVAFKQFPNVHLVSRQETPAIPVEG